MYFVYWKGVCLGYIYVHYLWDFVSGRVLVAPDQHKSGNSICPTLLEKCGFGLQFGCLGMGTVIGNDVDWH